MEYDFRFKQLGNCDENANTTLKLVPKLNVYYGKMYLSGYILANEDIRRFSEVSTIILAIDITSKTDRSLG